MADWYIRSYERKNARGKWHKLQIFRRITSALPLSFLFLKKSRLFVAIGLGGVSADQYVLEWQLDNNGHPLLDSDDSEGSENVDALTKSEGHIQGSVAGKTVLSPAGKPTISGPEVTPQAGARMHRDRDLKNTFLVDRDTDAKAAWRRGQPWTGE